MTRAPPPPKKTKKHSSSLPLTGTLSALHEQVSHAVADQPAGPYTKIGAAVQQPFHHNPTVAYDNSTGTFLLYSIGNGSATPNNCSGGDPSRVPSPLGDPAAAGIITLSYASCVWLTSPTPWPLHSTPTTPNCAPFCTRARWEAGAGGATARHVRLTSEQLLAVSFAFPLGTLVDHVATTGDC